MKKIRQLIRQTLFEFVTTRDLKNVEDYADNLFSDVGVDVEFTKHFLDRVNDLRNKTEITPDELKQLYLKTYKKYSETIPMLKPGEERVITDPETNINIPFVMNWDGKSQNLDIVNKTVMRKKDFKSYTPILKLDAGLSEDITIPIEVGDEVLGGKFKNKTIKVKEIGENEKGDITINGKPLMRFRIKKKDKQVSEGSVKSTDKIDIYRDNDSIVIRPLTEKASCKYGAYTKWCISAPSSGAWDSNPNAIVIMVIQKNYSIDPKRELAIQKFLDYNELSDNGELTPKIQRQWDQFLDKNNYDYHEFEDLSKIALVFGGSRVEIWDANNIPLDDNYQFGWQHLPISNSVIDAIENYISTL